MNISFEINGIAYVGAREIERHYNLCKSKAWKLLKGSGITPIVIATSFFYPVDEIASFIKQQ
ncbi:hypothetical protein Q5H92_24680 [Hymenobacter sp. M29]|uniref:DNA-binding protein n=1 Tax=Hymenobacter mellowenesis TaxID=3063995 RepID=A0ABT9AI84_9BACT|nr:hypothetical protein [Hymenobacter sp. M29]MDO7849581.1 hypothetical protein [Hymenobacter sp. M29]